MIMFMAPISNWINSYKMILKSILSTDLWWEVAVLKLAEFVLGWAHKREVNLELSGTLWGEETGEKFSVRRQQAGGQQKNPLLNFNVACAVLKFPWNTPQMLGKDYITWWYFINGASENWEKILSKFRTHGAERRYQAAGVQIRLATGIKRKQDGGQITTGKTDKNPSGTLRKSWEIYQQFWEVTEITDLIWPS